ncbi:MAG: TetR family transcriptional regulator [Devosia sp.]|nr:TetR family transcriptional regulator [Devosia sp.]
MARPRTVSEEAVLDAAGVLVGRGGSAALTFAAVGAAAGLAAATLVQRYGGREALLRATLLRLWDGLDERTAAADAGQAIDPAGAIALLVALSAGSEPDMEPVGLLLMREGVRDPVLRARGVAWGEVLAVALGRRLTPVRAAQTTLGRLMASQWLGALLWPGDAQSASVASKLTRELREWCAVVLPDGQLPR